LPLIQAMWSGVLKFFVLASITAPYSMSSSTN